MNTQATSRARCFTYLCPLGVIASVLFGATSSAYADPNTTKPAPTFQRPPHLPKERKRLIEDRIYKLPGGLHAISSSWRTPERPTEQSSIVLGLIPTGPHTKVVHNSFPGEESTFFNRLVFTTRADKKLSEKAIAPSPYEQFSLSRMLKEEVADRIRLPANLRLSKHTEKHRCDLNWQLPDGLLALSSVYLVPLQPAPDAKKKTELYVKSNSTSVIYELTPREKDFLLERIVVTTKPGKSAENRKTSTFGKGWAMPQDSQYAARYSFSLFQKDHLGDENTATLRRLLARPASKNTRQWLSKIAAQEQSISSMKDADKPLSMSQWTKTNLTVMNTLKNATRGIRKQLSVGFMPHPVLSMAQELGKDIWDQWRSLGPQHTALVFGPGRVDAESEAYLRGDASLKAKGIILPGPKATVYAYGSESESIGHRTLEELTGQYHYTSGRIHRLKPGKIPQVDFAWSKRGPDYYYPRYDVAISHMLNMLKEPPGGVEGKGGVLRTHTSPVMTIRDPKGNDVTEKYLHSIKGVEVIYFKKVKTSYWIHSKDGTRPSRTEEMFLLKDVPSSVKKYALQRKSDGVIQQWERKTATYYQVGFRRTGHTISAPPLKRDPKNPYIENTPPSIVNIWETPTA